MGETAVIFTLWGTAIDCNVTQGHATLAWSSTLCRRNGAWLKPVGHATCCSLNQSARYCCSVFSLFLVHHDEVVWSIQVIKSRQQQHGWMWRPRCVGGERRHVKVVTVLQQKGRNIKYLSCLINGSGTVFVVVKRLSLVHQCHFEGRMVGWF